MYTAECEHASNRLLPVQGPPVGRGISGAAGSENPDGVEAAQTACDDLTGMAQQMCYAVVYGVEM